MFIAPIDSTFTELLQIDMTKTAWFTLTGLVFCTENWAITKSNNSASDKCCEESKSDLCAGSMIR